MNPWGLRSQLYFTDEKTESRLIKVTGCRGEDVTYALRLQSPRPIHDGTEAVPSHRKSDVGGVTHGPSVQQSPSVNGVDGQEGWKAHRGAGLQAWTFIPRPLRHLLTGNIRTGHTPIFPSLSACLAVKQK